MPSPSVERLQKVTTFPQLVKYLRDELEWPIDQERFDDLVFDWDAEELGLDLKTAAKICEIKQLRPLTASQPWGIFFVRFEPKRLPIVALRRILSQLVIRKRASARKADQQTWQARDLLFISSHGEGGERQITFAHFNEPANDRDLPTLRVLGWDGDDTNLHLDHTAKTLKEKLTWPTVDSAIARWRDTWSSAFVLRPREVIRTSKDLAIRLADLAKGVRDRARVVLDMESESGPLTRLHKAFREALIHDLSEPDFADMYAQTITYGLFSAAVSGHERSSKGGLIAEDVGDQVPVTNPFLRELLGNFVKAGGRRGRIDFDELGIQEVVNLLNSPDTHLDAVLRDFGNRTRDEDPVIHFYESFLLHYDKAKKVSRGVFYTPQPVVSYIVRSVHELLRTEFALADGLADTTTWGQMVQRRPELRLPPLTDEPGEERTISPDEPFVQVLDPATGTATFLVEVIDVIHQTLTATWKQQRLTASQQRAAWNVYVPKHLLPRLHAFELMMAPYAIAHMKVGLKLVETGYSFGTDERARIYLTNALEPWVSQLPLIGFDALAHEAADVNEIKRSKRFTVVVGNPPYAGISSNMSENAQRIVDPYRIADGAALNERKVWLQDDYVKFIRKAQTVIDGTGAGVLGYITNHGYLDNPTFRGMRQSLLGTFNRMFILDLHGNANKKERSPDQTEDKNVFDIRQGVAVCLATRGGPKVIVEHSALWGSRDTKYAWLTAHQAGNTAAVSLLPDSPFYYFKPENTDRRAEYGFGWSLPNIFRKSGVGIVTARDALTIDIDSGKLWERVQNFAELAPEQARARYDLGKDVQSWKVKWAQEDVRKSGPSRRLIQGILYRPFDMRHIYYTGKSSGFICRPVYEVMRHMLRKGNIGLITTRSIEIGRGYEHVFCSTGFIQHHSVSIKEVNYLFPLWLETDSPSDGERLALDGDSAVNLSRDFVRAFVTALGLPRSEPDGLPGGLTPEHLFHYAYAVFHSPGYRRRYSEFLKSDFPRLPLTSKQELFRSLAQLGGELVAQHLLELPKSSQPITEFIGERKPEVERPSWSKNTVWVDKAQTTGFKGVREAVWNFHIGGYQVCEKWLKDRKGRTLSREDISHYQEIVVALSETIRIMKEIDDVIEKHGGWPGAFRGRDVVGDSSGAPLLKVAEPKVSPYGDVGTE